MYLTSSINSGFMRRWRTFIALSIFIIVLMVGYWSWQNNTRYWKDLYIMAMVKAQIYEKETEEPVKLLQMHRHKNRGLILDTPGCKIPKLNPFDPSIIGMYEAKEPYPCPGPPLFMKSKPDGSISLNASVLETHYNLTAKQLRCVYQPIRRRYEKPGNFRENDYEKLAKRPLQFDVPLEEDYVRVQCIVGKKKNFYQYFPLVRLKKEIEDKKSKMVPPEPRLNIILAGVDSISKLSFLRHFNKTYDFIKEKKTFLDMKGYVKLGDNTFPNLNNLLTGRFPYEVWNETLQDTMYFDDVDIIWKRYAAKGYRTFYAEDSPYFGLYNYGRRGFNETPVDYYIRPLYLAIHNSEVRKDGPWYCFNSQFEPDLMFDYLRDFVQAMGNRPYFAFAMTSAITHDYFNHAGYADYPTVKLLEDLWSYGADNNSVVVLFGDHGLRFGDIHDTYLGKVEERMPFMYIHYPPWFLNQHPEIAKNLHANQERLITLFDIHATMLHLLHPTQEQKERQVNTPYGLSLMEEISPYRTCEQASIYPFWCTCQVIQDMSVEDPAILRSAKVVTDCINSALRLNDASCPVLEVGKVTSAKLGQFNDMVLRFMKHVNVAIDRGVAYGDRVVKYEDFILTVVTEPDGWEFESTVRHDVKDDVYCVMDIVPLSTYERQNNCINIGIVKDLHCCNK